MSIKKVGDKIVETIEVIREYTKEDIDEEIKMIDEEIDIHQNEIDRLNKDLKIWQDRKNLLREVIKK